ncbi:MAG TPA: Xaa-Pro peptidase family protein [Streptosporangiaceae bacterium]|nr:Xaa-Pro peptidase family protein [Streptosporangiaceae bacterium]
MPDAHAARRKLLAAKIAESGAEAALITDLVNVGYLTGLASSNAALLVTAAGDRPATLATDSRYAPAAERDCPEVDLLTTRNVAAGLAAHAASLRLRRVLFEAHAMTVEQHAALASGRPEIGLAPLGRAVEGLRVVKDEEEITVIAVACGITCRALDETLPSIRPGSTERQLAIALERRMVELGADKPGFATIVASGPNGAIPHHVPTSRPVQLGDLITMDLGACYRGYHADMTRTVAVGEPAGWQRDVYSLVAAAQQAGVDAVQPGAPVAQVDAAARDLIAAAGHGEHFGHGLGHGIGLEIHEAPLLHHEGTGTLGDRVPITVEPGIYLPGKGGVRIEDTLVVRSRGPAELLTTTTKELLVL